MAKLEPFIKIRRDNVEYWNAALRRHARWLRECPGRDTAGSRAVWFGYPITVRPEAPFSRDDLTRFLERSEERRVGKEWRDQGSAEPCTNNDNRSARSQQM